MRVRIGKTLGNVIPSAFVGGDTVVSVQAVATSTQPVAAFTVGSRLLRLEKGGLLSRSWPRWAPRRSSWTCSTRPAWPRSTSRRPACSMRWACRCRWPPAWARRPVGGGQQPDAGPVAERHADRDQQGGHGGGRHHAAEQCHQDGAAGHAAEPAGQAVRRWRRAGSAGGGRQRHVGAAGERQRAKHSANRAGDRQQPEPDRPGAGRAAAGRAVEGAHRRAADDRGGRRGRHGHQRGHPRLPAHQHEQYPRARSSPGHDAGDLGRPAGHHRRGPVHRHAREAVPGAADLDAGHHQRDLVAGQCLPGPFPGHDLRQRHQSGQLPG